MPLFLLGLLILVSAGMVVWGFQRPERLYQYPTLAGATWLLCIVPQAIGTVTNPSKIPQAVLASDGLETALSMCILCAGAG